MPPRTGAYRPDIDGLRALSILPVVLFHFQVPGFGGGFVGVDVFFLISGYLITGLLIDPDRPVSLAQFYARRIRRLAPALAVVLAAATVAAWGLLPPPDLTIYGESLAAAASGVSNVYFWRELATYFAPKAETQPLLHTWSLGVEEQFYLLFPLLLLALRDRRKGLLPAVLAGGFALSLALAVYFAPRAPSASFYLAPTRAWELLGGALLQLGRPPRLGLRAGAAMALAGLALIVGAVLAFTAASQVPGVAALVPVSGAALLISAGSAAPGNRFSRMLAVRPLVLVGQISYPLYLWHWPVSVYLRNYVLLAPPAWWMTVLAVASATVLALLTWAAIERPLREGRKFARPGRAFAALTAFVIIGVGAGLWLARSDGHPERMPGLEAVSMPLAERGAAATDILPKGPGAGLRSGWLVRDDMAPRRILVWGDSYAQHLSYGFSALARSGAAAVYAHDGQACPPVLDYDPPSNRSCQGHNLAVLARIASLRIDTVVMAANWESYTLTGKLRLDAVASTAERIRAMGIRVVIVGQPPTYGFDHPEAYHYRRMRAGGAADGGWASRRDAPGLNAALAAAAPGAVFDPSTVFCRGTGCQYRRQGRYLVVDRGHLATSGSQALVGALLSWPGMGMETR